MSCSWRLMGDVSFESTCIKNGEYPAHPKPLDFFIKDDVICVDGVGSN